jgi:hypothetical protein
MDSQLRGWDRDRSVLLVLRLSHGDPPSVRSLRRPLDDVLTFAQRDIHGAQACGLRSEPRT